MNNARATFVAKLIHVIFLARLKLSEVGSKSRTFSNPSITIYIAQLCMQTAVLKISNSKRNSCVLVFRSMNRRFEPHGGLTGGPLDSGCCWLLGWDLRHPTGGPRSFPGGTTIGVR